MKVSVSDLTMIDSAGNILPLNSGTDSSWVAYFPTGIHDVSDINNQIQVYPNPAKD